MKRKYIRMTIQLMFGIKRMDKAIEYTLDEYPYIEMTYILAFISSASRSYFETLRR